MTSLEQQQWDIIRQVAEEPTTATAAAGIFVGLRGALSSSEDLIPGGFTEEKSLPFIVPLKKPNGTALQDVFTTEPAKGDQVTLAAGVFMIGGTEKDAAVIYLRLRHL